jgi:ribosomal RNA-processing protein 17
MGRREKLVITFDENARKDFVTGFRKRKNQRRKKAEREKTKQEKEAKRTLRAEKKAEEQKNVVVSTELMMDPLMAPIDDGSDTEKKGKKGKEAVVAGDEFTKKAFGADTVIVKTKMGFDADVDDLVEEDEEKKEEDELLAFFAEKAKTKKKAPAAGSSSSSSSGVGKKRGREGGSGKQEGATGHSKKARR